MKIVIGEHEQGEEFRFLVALPPAPDLLLSAKNLFFAAMVAIVPAGGQR